MLAYLEDEHERYWLYWSLLDEPSDEDMLLDCLRLDPDPAMAGSVMWDLLERRSPDERRTLLSGVPVSARGRLEKRAADLDLLDDCLRSETAEDDLEVLLPQLISGSDWLQRAVAQQASSAVLLEALATRGRAKRIRSIAFDKLRHPS